MDNEYTIYGHTKDVHWVVVEYASKEIYDMHLRLLRLDWLTCATQDIDDLQRVTAVYGDYNLDHANVEGERYYT